MRRTLYDDTHDLFRDAFRAFVEKEVRPHVDGWERAGIVDKAMFRKAGEAGFLGMAAPVEYGGGGAADFRFNAVMNEEFCAAGVGASAACVLLHNDTCLPYFLAGADDDQKARWLPGICSGELMTAIAMMLGMLPMSLGLGDGGEQNAPLGRAVIGGLVLATASTLFFVPKGVVLSERAIITNGFNADLFVVACKTDPTERHKGMSLLVVEGDRPGFERGRNLDKIGQHAQDTAEIFFNDVRVPVANRLGEEGSGFRQLVTKLPQERLSLAVNAVAAARAAFGWTLEYCKERTAFGQPIGSFQHNRFKLAEMRTEIDLGQVFVDRQVEALNAGELTAEDAAEGKWWCTEMAWRTLDTCLQLHGGYGYMEEYPIARAWRDGRIPTIYGGTTEIMKEIIGRSLGL